MPTIATSTAVDFFNKGLTSVTGLGISVDMLVVGVLVVLLLAFGIHYGRNAAITLIVALYIALALYANFPYTDRLVLLKNSAHGVLYSHLVIFFLLMALGYAMLSRVLLPDFSARTPGRILDSIILALTTAGLLVAFSYHIFPLDSIYNFGPAIDRLFASTTLFFWWLIAPLGAIYISTRL